MIKYIYKIGLVLFVIFFLGVHLSIGDNVKTSNVQKGSPPIARFSVNPPIPAPSECASYRAKNSYDPDGYIVLYEWDWNNDGIYEENHTIPTAVHAFDTIGQYQVTLRVTDNESLNGTNTKTVIIDNAPEKPSIIGPRTGIPDVEYEFYINGSDPDYDKIYYEYRMIDDPYQYIHETIGPYPSGTNVTVSIIFYREGYKYVGARTIDIYGKASGWSAFGIDIPRNKFVYNLNLLNFLENNQILRWFILRIVYS